ncbi:MAG: hypothetical protein IJJ31_05705 [Mogibacterium sp.]|nr:hypothetical protein [Mogibacterium sp.]
MCTIMTTTGSLTTVPEFEEAFARTKYRGPDDTRLVDTAEQRVLPAEARDRGISGSCRRGIMGFHRLSIMGLTPEGMQPFLKNGCSVVCNGELYGFEKMKRELESEGYTFMSGSDCELLLPLWFEHGTDMFNMLDAEFACVIYDGRTDEFIAARDPIGIRPLYYGYDGEGCIAFASEPKSLLGICGRIMPFPPGCYWRNGEFIRYRDMTFVRGYPRPPLKAAML